MTNRGYSQSYTGRCTGTINDHNVRRLVQAWLGHTPATLDKSFADFLQMPSRTVQCFGPHFEAQHQELVKRILIKYAETVDVISVMSLAPDTSRPSQYRRQYGNRGVEYLDEDEDDEERCYAEDFSCNPLMVDHARKLELARSKK